MWNYVFIQKQGWKMKRVVHKLWKLKAPGFPFSCHLHLRTVLPFIDFFCGQQWYSTYFDKLSQFIASMETWHWNGLTSELQGFLMQRENLIFLKLSIIMTINHILLCQTRTWACFKCCNFLILGNMVHKAEMRCILWHLPTSWCLPVETDPKSALNFSM